LKVTQRVKESADGNSVIKNGSIIAKGISIGEMGGASVEETGMD
jgi:hypothetical protein